MKTGTAFALGAVAGLAVGGAAGYFFTKRQLENDYRQDLEDAVAEVKEYYQGTLVKRYADPGEAVEELIPESTAADRLVESAKKQQADIIEEMAYDGSDPDEPVTETVKNIFEERNQRKPGLPYLIDQEEFMEEYHDEATGRPYDKMNFTWFDGDGVLAFEDETIVDNPDELVGLDNMNRFGEGEDSMLLHIRNEKAFTDYEVAKDERTFSEVVFGITEEELEDTPRKRAKKAQQEE